MALAEHHYVDSCLSSLQRWISTSLAKQEPTGQRMLCCRFCSFCEFCVMCRLGFLICITKIRLQKGIFQISAAKVCPLILLIQALALCKSFTYLLTYLLTYTGFRAFIHTARCLSLTSNKKPLLEVTYNFGITHLCICVQWNVFHLKYTFRPPGWVETRQEKDEYSPPSCLHPHMKTWLKLSAVLQLRHIFTKRGLTKFKSSPYSLGA